MGVWVGVGVGVAFLVRDGEGLEEGVGEGVAEEEGEGLGKGREDSKRRVGGRGSAEAGRWEG